MSPQTALQIARFLSDLSYERYLSEYRIAQALDADDDSYNQINSRIRGGPRSRGFAPNQQQEPTLPSEGSTGGAA